MKRRVYTAYVMNLINEVEYEAWKTHHRAVALDIRMKHLSFNFPFSSVDFKDGVYEVD